MSAKILDGRKTREALMPGLIAKIKALPCAPILAIIQVGDRPDSTSFIGAKQNFAKKLGIQVKHIKLAENVPQSDLIEHIKSLNSDKTVQGIIVQLPIPAHLERNTVINAIEPSKDVDALTPTNVSKWQKGESIIPATARGVRELLDLYKISLKGKKVAVVGRSDLVGKPIASMCMNEGAAVTVCHSKTPDLAAETKGADIVIVAVGKPRLIGKDHVSSGQVIIDVGINTIEGEKLDDEIPGKKLVGDVDFEAVKDVVSAISPVPGGVGPMTVLAFFENLVDLSR